MATVSNQVSFTDDEYDALSNMLSVLALNLLGGATEIAGLCPGSRIEERLRMDAERAQDFVDRIEAR